MVTSRPHVRRLAGALAAVVVVLAVTGACTDGGRDTAPTPSGSTPSASASGAAAVWWQTRAACLVSPDTAKTFLSTTTWKPPAGAHVSDIAPLSPVSPDGWILTEERSKTFNGASLWNVRTDQQVRIREIANPKTYGPAGAFDGRYVLWQGAPGLGSSDDVRMYIDDLTTGTQRDLGTIVTDTDVKPYANPADPVEAQDGYGMWVTGWDQDQRVVTVVNLASGKVRTLVSDAGIAGAHLDEGVVTVTYGDRRHEQFDVTSGLQVTGPWVHEFDGLSMVTFGADWAAAVDERSGNDLWFKPTPDAPTQLVLHLPDGRQFQNVPYREGRFLVYPDSGPEDSAYGGLGSFALDLDTGLVFQVSGIQGSYAAGNVFVSSPRPDASAPKGAPSTALDLRTVDPDKLTPDLCADPQPAPTPSTDGPQIAQP